MFCFILAQFKNSFLAWPQTVTHTTGLREIITFYPYPLIVWIVTLFSRWYSIPSDDPCRDVYIFTKQNIQIEEIKRKKVCRLHIRLEFVSITSFTLKHLHLWRHWLEHNEITPHRHQQLPQHAYVMCHDSILNLGIFSPYWTQHVTSITSFSSPFLRFLFIAIVQKISVISIRYQYQQGLFFLHSSSYNKSVPRRVVRKISEKTRKMKSSQSLKAKQKWSMSMLFEA